MKKLSLISMILKFLYTGLAIVLPSMTLQPSEYGNYALQVSFAIVLIYVFEFGISFSSLVIKRSDMNGIEAAINCSYSKDFINFLMCIVCFLLFNENFFYILLAVFCGSSSLSWQTFYRITGDYVSELLLNVLILFSFLIAFVFLYQNSDFGVTNYFFMLIVFPRIVGFIFTIFRGVVGLNVLHFLLPSSFLNGSKWHNFLASTRTNYSYWMQSILNVASSNVDVLIAAMFLSIADVGRLKLVTTVIIITLVLPEIFSNYSINERVNKSDESKRGLFEQSNLVHFSAFSFGLLSVLCQLFLSFSYDGRLSIEAAVVVTTFIVVFLRIYIVLYAANLTVTGMQKERFISSLIVNTLYWALVLALAPFYGLNGCLVAMCMSSIIHCAIYNYGWKR